MSFVYLDQRGRAHCGGLAYLDILVRRWIRIEQDDDAVVFALVKDIGSGEYALSRSAALRLVNGDVHVLPAFLILT
jgi:hypothetical protein